MRPQYLKSWADPSVQTSCFAGSELGCIVAMETFDWMFTQNTLGRITDMARQFELGFENLAETFGESIFQIRQRGLLIAIEFQNKHFGALMVRELAARGVASTFVLENPQIQRLQRSAVFSDFDVDYVLDALADSLHELQKPSKRFQDALHFHPH